MQKNQKTLTLFETHRSHSRVGHTVKGFWFFFSKKNDV
jgi:hypothetical protein